MLGTPYGRVGTRFPWF